MTYTSLEDVAKDYPNWFDTQTSSLWWTTEDGPGADFMYAINTYGKPDCLYMHSGITTELKRQCLVDYCPTRLPTVWGVPFKTDDRMAPNASMCEVVLASLLLEARIALGVK
jgi:hypothetical protein